MAVHSISVTESGIVYTGRCLFHGFYVGGMDGSNDATVTIYDALAASGNEVVPGFDADASLLGLNGALQPTAELMENGIYVEITCSGTSRVVCKVEA
jgi:hypothetical protein